MPYRVHYETIWKRSGKKPPELDNELPRNLLYLWDWFIELHNTRGHGYSGAMPITYAEIKAWSELTGKSPLPWEVRAIKAMDAIACKTRESET